MIQDQQKYFGGVVEPWWVNSKGAAIFVPEGVPLFYSWNQDGDGRLCLRSQYKEVKQQAYSVVIYLFVLICELF